MKSPYFTKEELSKAFGYKSVKSYYSSRGKEVLDDGVNFVVGRVEKVKDEEILFLKRKIQSLLDAE